MSGNEITNQDFYSIFEVFSQKNPMASFMHQFSLLAPNHEIALTMARENFLRREPCYNIWVVKRADVFGLSSEERQYLERLDNKNYREMKGYSDIQSRWRNFREQYEQNASGK